MADPGDLPALREYLGRVLSAYERVDERVTQMAAREAEREGERNVREAQAHQEGEALREEVVEARLEIARLGTRMRVLWGIAGALGGGVIALTVALLLGDGRAPEPLTRADPQVAQMMAEWPVLRDRVETLMREREAERARGHAQERHAPSFAPPPLHEPLPAPAPAPAAPVRKLRRKGRLDLGPALVGHAVLP